MSIASRDTTGPTQHHPLLRQQIVIYEKDIVRDPASFFRWEEEDLLGKRRRTENVGVNEVPPKLLLEVTFIDI